MRFALCLSVVSMMALLVAVPCTHAAEHNVTIDAFGFDPGTVSILSGDSIRFYNFTGMTVNVLQTSGPCPAWGYSFPSPGNYSIPFICPEGTDTAYCAEVADTLTINISVPGPTPTPDLYTPSTTPIGITIALILMGIALSFTAFKQR